MINEFIFSVGEDTNGGNKNTIHLTSPLESYGPSDIHLTSPKESLGQAFDII